MGQTAFPYQAIRGLPAQSLAARNAATAGPLQTVSWAAASTGDVLTVQGDGTVAFAAVSAGIGGSTGSVDNAILRADGTGGATLQASGWIIADNYTSSPNATVNHASIQATGGTTNVSVSIVPKGTGAFSLHVPNGAATGGNVRGANAVDLQTSRSAASQVASGTGAFAAGVSITVSGDNSAAIGVGHNVSAAGAFAAGSSHLVQGIGSAVTGVFGFSNSGERTHCRDTFTSQGGQQIVDTVLRVATSGTTVGNMDFRVRSGYVQSYIAQITGAKSGGTSIAAYFRKIAVKNIANTLTLLSVETIGTDYEDNAAADLTISVSGTNLRFGCTGIAGEDWRWCAVLYGMDNQWG